MISMSHILIVLLVVLVLFGAGRLPRVLGDLGKGIRNFKEGLRDGDQKSLPNDKDKTDNGAE